MRIIFDQTKQRVPIKAWLEEIEPGALEQALNLSRLPFAFHHVALMPDAHQGYGMPVGGVLAAKGHVIPNAVGVDIGCFTGDTLIPMIDGKNHRLDDLAACSRRGDELFVYACTPSGRVMVARANAQRTRRAAPVMQVTLDNGETIRCTPDHQFMLRDGTYRQAQDLTTGTSLMPLYTRGDKDGYTLVQQNYSGRWQKAHWVVARSGLLGEIARVAGQRTVIHHRNFDEADNWPANLQFMGDGDHAQLHRGIVERNTHWQSPAFERKRIAALSAKAMTLEGHREYAERGTPNLLQYMASRPEHFRAAVAGNGQRGKQYLIAYNRSERGRAKSKEIANRLYTCEICGAQARSGLGIHNHRRSAHGYNHTVASVQLLAEREDVYCLTVPDYHNFALAAGVFVHNCGMQARRTNLRSRSLAARHRGHGTLLKAVLNAIQRDVPNGNGPIGNHRRAQPWEAGQGSPELAALLPRAPDALKKAWEHSTLQLGTLGGGNHFLEVQQDHEGYVWIMLHSGSRALGRHVCDHFNAVASQLDERLHAGGPREAQLAFLPLESDEGQEYVAWMHLCLRYAEENRQRMLNVALERLFEEAAVNQPEKEFEITESVDTHHNYAAAEVHFGEEVFVHRKGSVRATAGEKVIIPGSMETGSYVALGLGNEESFQSCSHGAGRRLSRTAALKARTAEQVMNSLRMKGIELAKRSHKDVAEEAGHAYKDVDSVMAQQTDLVEAAFKLRPLGVVKG